ncbi:D-proline reductase (dithiol) proprotein PrdA [Clostridium sporogenes]|uniref:D-proline reductase (dithiol) proprotein PrdA n=1 Tax=Clostridium sporogenes TaxID=1509 RepID=UPI0013D51BBC|nr:D-proline reductase (dithiol) proprotein PrdA [Clostridium sporogenes]MBA4510288.1 D-proline reductase (dithiol) proprotein PrdA [Clostridium sporogenes]MDU6337825.1 D-proline reductase (dithiol) proprotein PrdA [Clostridium sporogenes]NFQ86418.1 D-proline reductase (dithiol) proprotein PrdA [Clostridium sporogenes]
MSMTAEHAEALKNEHAVVCCRTEEGTILSADNLEDPEIFPDMVDSGLLTIPDNCLKVGEVIGAKLLKTVDSLTPLTSDIVEGAKKIDEEGSTTEEELTEGNEKAVLKYNLKTGDTIKASDLENPMHFPKLVDSLLISLDERVLTREEVVGATLSVDTPALTPVTPDILEGFEEEVNMSVDSNATVSGGTLRIKIAEGRGIDIEVPLNGNVGAGKSAKVPTVKAEKGEVVAAPAVEGNKEVKLEEKVIRSLTRKHYKIDKVEFGPETKIEGTTLYIREGVSEDAKKVSPLVKKVEIDIITPDKYNTYSETIMDVQPIATKEGDNKLGTGATRVLDGVIVMVTGTDENGVQIGEFGSSEGILEENIMFNRPGSPDKGEIFIKTQVTIKEKTNMERPGPMAAHKATDFITQEIREAMKALEDESLVVNTETFEQKRRPGKKKVVVVKEIMGQGAMHDNLILPVEPVGYLGGKPNVDLGNVPVMLSPLEVLDGGIHALTCIGPASKECSRHYWREPLVMECMKDEELDLCGVIFVGSPQINSEKFYVSERMGMMVEALDVDGAFVTTEGFGNNHIDFASHVEQIGMRGIPCVAFSFCAVQGALVVGNKYMKYMIDNNKSEGGIENEVLECNTLCPEDAIRGVEMLKSAMAGEDVKKPERAWNANVKENNLELIEKAENVKIERVLNETSIPMSEKRKEKYSTK